MQAKELSFGVEIECLVPAQAMTDQGIEIGGYHSGLPVPGFPGWKAERDGSLSCRMPNMQPVEFVGGVFQGTEGLEKVKSFVTWLNRVGAQVNKTCGLHIHVGAGHLDAKGLARLVCLVARYEKALYASTGTRVREEGVNGRIYCGTVKNDGEFKSYADRDGLVRIPRDRFKVLNLSNLAYGSKRTAEFRCFAGTTNLLKILGAIQIALGLVVKATNDKRKKEWDLPEPKRPEHRALNSNWCVDAGEGERALKCLTYGLLYWSHKSKRQQFILEDETINAVAKELLTLARKYDGNEQRRQRRRLSESRRAERAAQATLETPAQPVAEAIPTPVVEEPMPF